MLKQQGFPGLSWKIFHISLAAQYFKNTYKINYTKVEIALFLVLIDFLYLLKCFLFRFFEQEFQVVLKIEQPNTMDPP